VREFEIIGEAAGKISLKAQHQYPEIPWKQMIGMRNRLIHAYFDIDYDILWKTIQNSLPELRDKVEKVISQFELSPPINKFIFQFN